MHIHICSRCGIEGEYYSKNLCKKCYKMLLRQKKTGVCVKCKGSHPLNNKGICGKCLTKENQNNNLHFCANCGILKPNIRKGLCAACYAREYRKATGYIGPTRQCIACNNIRPIHANGMCCSCNSKLYRLEHLEELKQYDKQYYADNRESIRKRQIMWRASHKEAVRSYCNKYYYEHWEHSKKKSRLRARKNKENLKIMRHNMLYKGTEIRVKRAMSLNERIAITMKQIPIMKRQWVQEFLSGPYKDHSERTIKTFLSNIVRLIKYLEKEGIAQGAWNLVELIDLEKCQVETGILKDSLRVFFTWLHRRKHVRKNLAEAIPPNTLKLRKTILPFEKMKELYDRWIHVEGNFIERIAGLLIIHYGFTTGELRNLKLCDYKHDRIMIDGEEIIIHENIRDIINEYFDWRKSYYDGVLDENPYFFISRESYYTKNKVSEGYFAELFKKNGYSGPNIIRRTMIYFFRNDPHKDVFKIAALFRIRPVGAARYWS